MGITNLIYVTVYAVTDSNGKSIDWLSFNIEESPSPSRIHTVCTYPGHWNGTKNWSKKDVSVERSWSSQRPLFLSLILICLDIWNEWQAKRRSSVAVASPYRRSKYSINVVNLHTLQLILHQFPTRSYLRQNFLSSYLPWTSQYGQIN